ncbi:MAG: 16S rRNA (cytosine(1402)-N(4))-methyltransferase RsmH, partial [Deltaproteobacteria bacterium]|nr:16S rRNA (cytosine(1402)-N(4))-methyltransferase RsmH [Deltaproteobacteria bacterium]
HTLKILDAAKPDGMVIGIDWDEDAINAAKDTLKENLFPDRNLQGQARVKIVKGNFADIKNILGGLGITKVNGIVFDLGVSSYHLEKPERGFSFRFDAPLDMRMDRDRNTTAYDLVNGLSERDLQDIFWQYGEERWAKKIAKAIVGKRNVNQIATTKELADIVFFAIPKRYHPSNIHPATRVFQALRIKVNDELENLKNAIDDSIPLLAPEGRFVVISFHSLEDRIVKQRFKSFEKGCICPSDFPECRCGKTPMIKVIARKPILPSASEIENNPRSRSAKMRVAEKI